MASKKKKSVGATILTVVVAFVVILMQGGGVEQGGGSDTGVSERGTEPRAGARGGLGTAVQEGGEEGEALVADAFRAERSDEQMTIRARVDRVLSDDQDGDRHQRFILRFAGSGRTVLISHNIDLAERVAVEEGDWVRVHGEYEWSDRGGVIHWTHRNPARNPIHPGGWIEHGGVRYE